LAERWTRERRVEHTRNLLLDAAEELFAQKGFGSATLEDIADAAGYTRGAIYAHFGAKEELFLAVTERHRQRFLDAFAAVISSYHELSELVLDDIATRWREMSSMSTDQAALGYELTLFLLRNPQSRERLARQRLDTVRSLGDFIRKGVEQLGGTLPISAQTLARLMIATSDGVVLTSHIDGEDLYRPFLELFMSSIAPSVAAAENVG
jgi:AcrR family transcriptional regulator